MQAGQAALIDRWHQTGPPVRAFGGIPPMECHVKRNAERPGQRQAQCTATPEMGMHDKRGLSVFTGETGWVGASSKLFERPAANRPGSGGNPPPRQPVGRPAELVGHIDRL